MANRYHINDKGEPGICSAEIACRFKLEESEHYNTPEEATKAYEEKQKAETISTSLSKKSKKAKMGVRALGQIAVDTDDQEVLADALSRNNPRLKDIVLGNKNTGEELLLQLQGDNKANTTQNPVAQRREHARIINHPNFPIDKLTDTEFDEMVEVATYRRDNGKLDKIMHDPRLTDGKINILKRYLTAKDLVTLVADRNNGLSNKVRTETIESNINIINEALKRKEYKGENFNKLSDSELNKINISDSLTDEAKTNLVNQILERPNISHDLIEKVTSSNTLPNNAVEKIAKGKLSTGHRLYSRTNNEQIKESFRNNPYYAESLKPDLIAEKAGLTKKELLNEIVSHIENVNGDRPGQHSFIVTINEDLARGKYKLDTQSIKQLVNDENIGISFFTFGNNGLRLVGGYDSSD